MNASIGVRQSSCSQQHDTAILAEQTSQIYSATNAAVMATLINASILVIVLWTVIGHDVLLIWLSMLMLISLARGITAYQYKIADPAPEKANLWYRQYLLWTILTSLVWGGASIWLFPVDDLARQAFLAFVIGGMSAGALTTLSPMKLTINLYLGFCLIPLLIRFFYSGTELGMAMGSMLTVYLLMMLVAANRAHNNIKQSISLRIEVAEQDHSLQQSEHRYKTLLETATDAFFLHDVHGRFLDVNQQACRSLGYSRDELLELSVYDIEVSVQADKLGQLWPKLEKGENQQVEGIHRRKDGSTFPVEVNFALIGMDNETLFSVLVRDVTERKQAEDALRASQQRMALHVQRTPLGVIEWDMDFCVTEWNPAATTIFGFTREQALGCHAKNLIIPSQAAVHVDDIWQSLLAAKGGLRSANENMTKDGSTILCEWYNTPLVNDAGDVMGVASLVHDVTEQKQAQQKIQESESNYRSLFELSEDANIIMEKGGFVDCNQATLKMFGYASKQEFLSQDPNNISPVLQADGADSSAAAEQHIITAYKDGKNFFEWTHRRANGDVFPAEILLTPMKLDGKSVLQGIVRDITDRKQTEQQLKHSAEVFRDLYESIPLAYISVDNDGNISECNNATVSLLGYRKYQILGKPEIELYADTANGKEKAINNNQKLLSGDAISGEELQMLKADGGVVWVGVSIQAETEGHHRRAMIEDITERKQAEAEIIAAKQEAESANQAKSEFLSRMSHELRTPLNAILGFAQIMEMSGDEMTIAEHHDSLNAIIQSGWHLLRIIDDVLNLASIEANKIELNIDDVSVKEHVQVCIETMLPLFEQSNIVLDYDEISCQDLIVRADPFRLKQVLLNLIANAVKFNHEGGSVSVGWQTTHAGRIRIEVSDRGPGIRADDIPLLFQSFSRLSEQTYTAPGAGIGLSIAKQLTELMAGTIGVESVYGEGSLFWIELPPGQPLVENVAVGRASNPDTYPTVTAETTMLYIEDNPSHIQLFEALVENMPSITLFSANTPELGLELAQLHRPDIIVLDICLQGMDGFEIRKRLAASEVTRDIPVIAVSANAMPGDIEKGVQAGFYRYLTKPINVIEFREVINELLSDRAKPLN